MPSINVFAVVFIFALIFYIVLIYNRLITLKNRVSEGWSDIDVQLKRRYDLIPNLLATVKGYARHEKNVFERVSELRSAALSSSTIKEKAQADNLITSALKSVFAVAESYPVLRSSENFKSLQEELADSENKIAASRRFYNGVTRDYNTLIESFPHAILARWFRFNSKELFELANESHKTNPNIKI